MQTVLAMEKAGKFVQACGALLQVGKNARRRHFSQLANSMAELEMMLEQLKTTYALADSVKRCKEFKLKYGMQ